MLSCGTLRRRFNKLSAVSAGAFAAALISPLVTTTPAQALTIIPSFTTQPGFIANSVPIQNSTNVAAGGTIAQVEGTINADISTLESYISTPETVYVDFVDTSPSGLGESATYDYTIPYSSYLTALQTDQTLSPADVTAIATLNPALPYNHATGNPVNGNATITLTGPLLRALFGTGALADNSTANPDSCIGVNLSITNTGRGNGTSGYDLQSTVAHELDEVLGVGGAGSQLNVAAGSNTLSGPVGPLDLFRFSGAATRSYSTSANVSSYFSINGGTTDRVHFNQNGASDNSDFADWGDGVTPADGQPNSPPQVQDAYNGPSDAPNLGTNELTALDVVGWNLTPAGTAVEAVPEPASIGLLAVGAFGLLARRRRQDG